MIRHAGLIARRLAGRWRGVLIEGPSGIGKSDLALRALAEGFHLVADDRTLVFASGGRPYGRAPDSLAGLIEVRGLGVIQTPDLAFAEIALVVRCLAAPEAVERLPPQQVTTICGLDVPVFDLWPLEPAAPAKIRRMLEHLGVGL
ncbi:HPr kinase/phosphorylase [Caulobacter henricii]|uniref:Serine kinase n=1 Tax=Caulobacter henricii TaxID=69395 RepID=A0A0N7JH06_9CAUL|nr:serine kinase [Caulobacter henricii]ALL12058.1 serine kinase [Caulobacter henricii]